MRFHLREKAISVAWILSREKWRDFGIDERTDHDRAGAGQVGEAEPGQSGIRFKLNEDEINAFWDGGFGFGEGNARRMV